MDIIIVVVIAIFMIKGYRRGLIRQLTAIIAIIISIYIANEQYLTLSKTLIEKFEISKDLGDVIAFVLIIFTVAIIINYLGYILSKMASFMLLSSIDRFSGFIFGFIKGLLIVYIVVLVLSRLPIHFIEEIIEQSYLASKLLILNPFVEERLSELSRW
ncbi:CvpA family protein [Halonatronum saccharophilum]|uniref:CvpA family protein n=1 Tax=Halonatronum saccharophilum TaxID=150060 RepID=UPI001B7FA48F|nr:CvpA family protein [Halonatronum saccharophilum]